MMAAAPKRICVVRLGGMGDILLATPAVRALARHCGTDQIDFIVGRGMKPALEGIPYLREIMEFDKGGADASLTNFLPFLKRLRAARYDLFVNFHPSVKTVLMALASGAPKVITFRKDRRRQPDTGRVRHAVDDFAKELKPLGIERVDDRHMDFFVPDAARRRVADLLRENGIGQNDPLLVVNPAATRDINRWPPDRFADFLTRFAAERPDTRVALSGGKGDVDLVRGIADNTAAPVLNLAGKVNVKELGALLERADTVLTHDTGPLHIASAVGAPIVCLSGAADPDRTGPLGQGDLVVINRELPCVPCQGRDCGRGDIACMTQMPVDWVMRDVKRRLAAGARKRLAAA
jgi:ADP-heptose:LPS heptosyltransferase